MPCSKTCKRSLLLQHFIPSKRPIFFIQLSIIYILSFQPSVEENEINNTSDFNNEGEKLYYTSPVIKSSHTAVDEACTSLKNNWKNEDLFSIFGEYVASRLRNLNTPRIQSICQYRINTILFELERDATASQCTEPISSTSTSQSNNHSFTSTSDYVTPDFFLSNINKEITDENY